jgi:hypothetical protein
MTKMAVTVGDTKGTRRRGQEWKGDAMRNPEMEPKRCPLAISKFFFLSYFFFLLLMKFLGIIN